jgi:hypothetical protein
MIQFPLFMAKARTHVSGVLLRSHRHVLLASAASLAALTTILLVPAAASAQPAGTPTITLALSPTTVDYGHQNVTASGTVTTSAGPVASAAVTVSYLDIDKQAAQISLTTGSDGRYSGTIPDPETAAQTVTASVAATSSTAAASASAQLGFTADAVTITASFAQPSVNAGSTDTLSGVASFTPPGGTPQPLANRVLTIIASDYLVIDPVSTTVTTAADGSFSYVTPDVGTADSSVAFTVSSAATAYLDAGQLTVSLKINQDAQFGYFSATVSPERVLQFSACAGIPSPLENGPLLGPVDFQYSTSRHGPWKTLGTAKSEAYNGSCSSGSLTPGDGTYWRSFKAPLANAYYRAYAPAVPGQMSAVSQVIRLHRDPTRITGFTMTPRRVSRGGKVTVSGRLWRLKGRWLPDAHGQIVIEIRYKGKTYTLTHRLTTNSAGRFHGVFPVPHTAEWLALYRGGGIDFGVASKAITVRVR